MPIHEDFQSQLPLPDSPEEGSFLTEERSDDLQERVHHLRVKVTPPLEFNLGKRFFRAHGV